MLNSAIFILCVIVSGDLLCGSVSNIAQARSPVSGRKRRVNEENWGANGKAYTSTAKKAVPEKKFEQVTGFKPPRTDVCDDCFKFEKGKETPEFVSHKLDVENYKALKKSILEGNDVLFLEFDFGQNLPIPKLPVTEQFYLRLLWLHIFNVNVLNKNVKRSYMYLFMEGKVKKVAILFAIFFSTLFESEVL
ncbi:hypothetical protein QAD02_014091 [Eretmocerus hayati]|uniref:Uncharacterized protein n=1 Tax=Eretmocerus hayati TaxID=131215 RepID=A0ACC2P6U4_9HYME|nr:hypothetical protein QAD02_014091 [Eretmocerus hayati]